MILGLFGREGKRKSLLAARNFMRIVQNCMKQIKKGDKCFTPFFADRTGLEPATSAVTGRHSNQLNYRSFFGWGSKNRREICSTQNKLLSFPKSLQKNVPIFIGTALTYFLK
jgi:hypothetical protein